ncbi:uL30 family ribosomal protein [Candidatus Woesearchaeota archaeon]|nr:uL30 family ribosomal protein [Candidatus Woesearchaeota archaeon]
MKIAIVRVRGDVRVGHRVKDTLRMFGLHKKNHCVVIEDSPSLQGMLHAASPHITWGPVDEKTLSSLKKKGEKVFALQPPRKGYGRKGIKVNFASGGALGNRGEKMNDLLMRMM